MKSNELRIGNLVDVTNRSNKVHLPTGIVLNVIAIGLFKAQCIDNSIPVTKANGNDIMSIPLSDLTPIPLTNEWLLKFGFKPDCNSIQFNLGMFMYENKNNLFYIGQESFAMEYVHQLQNLYFILTGTELQTQLK